MTHEQAMGEIDRLRTALRKITELPLGPDRASAQYQIDTATNIAREAMKPPTRKISKVIVTFTLPEDFNMREPLGPFARLWPYNGSASIYSQDYELKTVEVPL